MRSTQRASHWVNGAHPASAATHLPAVHVCAVAHRLPHAPQLKMSVAVSDPHRPSAPHVWRPGAHPQFPPLHACPARHARPHAPQFAGSLVVSTQAPAHARSVPMHRHATPTHSAPGPHAGRHAPTSSTVTASATSTASASLQASTAPASAGCPASTATHAPPTHTVPAPHAPPHGPPSTTAASGSSTGSTAQERAESISTRHRRARIPERYAARAHHRHLDRRLCATSHGPTSGRRVSTHGLTRP